MTKKNPIDELTEEQLDGGFDQLPDELRKRIMKVGLGDDHLPSTDILWFIAFVWFIAWLFAR